MINSYFPFFLLTVMYYTKGGCENIKSCKYVVQFPYSLGDTFLDIHIVG